MFSWFQPSCPCDAEAKAWVEDRLHFLHDEFPDNVYNGRRMILPLEEFFPGKYDETYGAVRTMFDQVCEYMDVIPDLVHLEIVNNKKVWLVNDAGQDLPPEAGTFELGRRKHRVRIDKSGLHHPMSLVGTIAHELAHVRLLGEGRYNGDAYDNELLTDLTVVFLGLGIFLANLPRNWRSGDTKWPETNLRKPEYMTPPMFGWALAHIAWHNDDHWPSWARHLKLDARANLKQGLKYLQKTGDSRFKP